MYYKLLDNKICCTKSDDGSVIQYAPWSHDVINDDTLEWKHTDKSIVRLPDFSFVFADDSTLLEELKIAKKSEIASARYDYEISGITFKNVHVTTDREDQAMITAIALSATLNNAFTTVWKGSDGYIDLNAQEVLTLAYLVAEHVEAAFAEEKRLAELIDSAQTEEELNAIVWSLKI